MTKHQISNKHQIPSPNVRKQHNAGLGQTFEFGICLVIGAWSLVIRPLRLARSNPLHRQNLRHASSHMTLPKNRIVLAGESAPSSAAGKVTPPYLTGTRPPRLIAQNWHRRYTSKNRHTP